jgi:hypothetical protein
MAEGHETQVYRTAHLALAAFLDVKGKKLLSVETNGSRCFMVFEHTDDLPDLVNEFWKGAPVSARFFAERFRDMKARIVEAKHAHLTSIR